MAPPAARGRWRRRVAWLATIWAASVLTLAVVAVVLRWWLAA